MNKMPSYLKCTILNVRQSICDRQGTITDYIIITTEFNFDKNKLQGLNAKYTTLKQKFIKNNHKIESQIHSDHIILNSQDTNYNRSLIFLLNK